MQVPSTSNRMCNKRSLISECEKIDNLPKLPDTFSCVLSDRCTALQCCIDVPFIQRAFEFTLDLNACTNTLTMGIEKYLLETSLLSYNWGQTEHINIKDVFQIE